MLPANNTRKKCANNAKWTVFSARQYGRQYRLELFYLPEMTVAFYNSTHNFIIVPADKFNQCEKLLFPSRFSDLLVELHIALIIAYIGIGWKTQISFIRRSFCPHARVSQHFYYINNGHSMHTLFFYCPNHKFLTGILFRCAVCTAEVMFAWNRFARRALCTPVGISNASRWLRLNLDANKKNTNLSETDWEYAWMGNRKHCLQTKLHTTHNKRRTRKTPLTTFA